MKFQCKRRNCVTQTPIRCLFLFFFFFSFFADCTSLSSTASKCCSFSCNFPNVSADIIVDPRLLLLLLLKSSAVSFFSCSQMTMQIFQDHEMEPVKTPAVQTCLSSASVSSLLLQQPIAALSGRLSRWHSTVSSAHFSFFNVSFIYSFIYDCSQESDSVQSQLVVSRAEILAMLIPPDIWLLPHTPEKKKKTHNKTNKKRDQTVPDWNVKTLLSSEAGKWSLYSN